MKPSPKLIAVLSRLLIGVAITGTLFAAFIVIENFRGDRAWKQVEKDLKARGESIDFRALQQAPIPDEMNFFKDKGVAFLVFSRPDNHERDELERKTRLVYFRDASTNLSSRQGFVNLRKRLRREGVITAPDSGSPAVDVLNAMQTCGSLLDEVRDAAKMRPLAALDQGQAPFEPPTIDMAATYGLGVALGIRASMEIEIGKTEEAYDDIVALERISDGLSQHPNTLISILVGTSLDGWVSGAVINGCKRNAWNDSQLASFQAGIEKMHPVVAIKEALQFERAYVLYFVDADKAIGFPEQKRPYWLFHGWLQQNKAELCVYFENNVMGSLDTQLERVYVDKLPKKGSERSLSFNSPYGWLWRNSLGNLGPIIAASRVGC